MIPTVLLTNSLLDSVAEYLYLYKYSPMGERTFLEGEDVAVVVDALIEANGGVLPMLADTPMASTDSNLRLWFLYAVPEATPCPVRIVAENPYQTPTNTATMYHTTTKPTGWVKDIYLAWRIPADGGSWIPRFRCRLLTRMNDLGILPPAPRILELV